MGRKFPLVIDDKEYRKLILGKIDRGSRNDII